MNEVCNCNHCYMAPAQRSVGRQSFIFFLLLAPQKRYTSSFAWHALSLYFPLAHRCRLLLFLNPSKAIRNYSTIIACMCSYHPHRLQLRQISYPRGDLSFRWLTYAHLFLWHLLGIIWFLGRAVAVEGRTKTPSEKIEIKA